MTAQSTDPVRYRKREYTLAGRNGPELFDPAAHGMTPVATCSSCWRGFTCTFAVRGEQLWIHALDINLGVPAPTLFGRAPRRGGILFDTVYAKLQHPLTFTGGLLVARGFLPELYVHMGFPPAWKFREVRELIFRDGRLVEEMDRSERVAAVRREAVGRPEPLGDVRQWIERCFSQAY